MAKMIDWTKPVRTIDDKRPVELVTAKGRDTLPVFVYIGDNTTITHMTLDGRFRHNGKVVVENIERLYLNVFDNPGSTGAYDRYIITQHASAAEADSDRNRYADFVAQRVIELTLGD